MSWKADQIYAKYNPKLIQYLSSIEGFADELFLVNDLEGIRSEFTNNVIFSDQENELNHQQHSLPNDGLLAIKPMIYRTSYDTEDDNDAFWNKYLEKPIDKWAFIEEDHSIFQDFPIKISESQRNLFSFLHKVTKEFNSTMVYYYCDMWGGEIAIVLDKDIKIYQYDSETNTDYQILYNNNIEIESTILQTTLKFLSLDLPTWFFALHETSFHWKRYHLSK